MKRNLRCILVVVICCSLSFIPNFCLFAQRTLMSTHKLVVHERPADIYCASLLSNWEGAFKILIPQYEVVNSFLVEAYYLVPPDMKVLPKETVIFRAEHDEIEVILPKKERHSSTKQDFFVYRTQINQTSPYITMESNFKEGPVCFKILAYRELDDEPTINSLSSK